MRSRGSASASEARITVTKAMNGGSKMSNNPRARLSCRPLLFRHSPLPQLIEVSRESTAPTGTGSASRRGRQAERVNVRTFSHLFAPFPHLVHTLEMACLQGKHGQEAISLFGVGHTRGCLALELTRQVLPQRGTGSASRGGQQPEGVRVRTFRTDSRPVAAPRGDPG
jgi:hypothetical protein